MNHSCIQRINLYLRQIKEKAARGLRGEKLRLVVGSQAADLDSLVASIVYAFFKQLEGAEGWTVLPFMPIPRQDLRLRPEALLLFQMTGLEQEWLVFADELNLSTLLPVAPAVAPGGSSTAGWPKTLEVIAVDTDGRYLESPLRERIVEVLDHHAGRIRQARSDARAAGALRVVEPVGSACTLVAERLLRHKPGIMDAGLAILLAGPILLDTVNLDMKAGRSSPKDRRIARCLLRIGRLEAAVFYAQLLEAKQDLPGLSTEEILRRDCKIGEAAGILYGVSSSPIPLRRWLEWDPDWEESLRQFLIDRGLDLLIVMIARQGEVFHRELIVCCPEPRLAERLSAYLETLPLELREVNGPVHHGVRCYEQAAVGFSRKNLEPLLERFLQGQQAGSPEERL